jgi:hypothetical protein
VPCSWLPAPSGSGVPTYLRSYLERAMPIAECEVVEIGLDDTRGIDRIGCLAFAPEVND